MQLAHDKWSYSPQGLTPTGACPNLVPTGPSVHYLVQTDPRFTNGRTWLGSDYMTNQLSLNPDVTQKRLGDGFYEQQLIREQVGQLTGQRFLGDYTNDQDQYQALMDAGITYAQAHNLRPGIALSADQIAQLTTDIVWLEQQTIKLPDGTTTQALVPRVYAVLHDGDVAPDGAMLGGAHIGAKNIAMQLSGDVNNLGTITARKTLAIDANNINQFHRMSADALNLNTQGDVNVIGGTLQAQSSLNVQAAGNIVVASTLQNSSSDAASTLQASELLFCRVLATTMLPAAPVVDVPTPTPTPAVTPAAGPSFSANG